jgi:hypothetical protein
LLKTSEAVNIPIMNLTQCLRATVRLAFLPFILMNSPLAAATDWQLDPWSIDESAITSTLYVNASARVGGDGSTRAPFSSIQEAVDRARRDAQERRGTRIRIAAGTYRELVNIENRPHNPPLVLEADEPGAVVLSGSDIFSDWRQTRDLRNAFEHHWPHKMGWEPNPWPGLMPLDGEGLRKEILFIDGEPMTQVVRQNDLAPGRYLVDEERARILLVPPIGVDLASAKVEVSVRPIETRGAASKLLRIFHTDNVVLRGLTIEHSSGPAFNSSAISILGSSNILIEDCVVRLNNGVGLHVEHQGQRRSRNVMIRRVHADRNGTLGMTGGFENGLIENSTTNRNNWRGAHWGATGWAPCGFKFSGMDRLVLRNHEASLNHASGAWFDHHNTRILIERLVAINNFRSGISIEADVGPYLIRDSIFMGNGVGVNGFDSSNVTVENSVIAGNLQKQIRIAGSTSLSPQELERFASGWRRDRQSDRRIPENWILRNNLITSSPQHPDAPLVSLEMRESVTTIGDRPALQPLLESLQDRENRYFSAAGPQANLFVDGSLRPVSWDRWQELVHRLDGSIWLDDQPSAELRQVAARLQQAPTGFPATGKLDDQLGL